jgi:hypothetical protein
MSFTIRPFRRFPLCCPVTYHAGLTEGYGTVWNVSLTGWRFTDNLPLRVGQSVPQALPGLLLGFWVSPLRMA